MGISYVAFQLNGQKCRNKLIAYFYLAVLFVSSQGNINIFKGQRIVSVPFAFEPLKMWTTSLSIDHFPLLYGSSILVLFEVLNGLCLFLLLTFPMLVWHSRGPRDFLSFGNQLFLPHFGVYAGSETIVFRNKEDSLTEVSCRIQVKCVAWASSLKEFQDFFVSDITRAKKECSALLQLCLVRLLLSLPPYLFLSCVSVFPGEFTFQQWGCPSPFLCISFLAQFLCPLMKLPFQNRKKVYLG